MSVPHRDDEPDESAGTDGIAGPPDGSPAAEPDHDAVWRAIVANYGDRHELGPEQDLPRGGHPAGQGRYALAGAEHPDRDPDPDPETDPDAGPDLARGPEDRYVPPPPPPLPWASPPRLLAWCGVLGIPVAVLVTLLVSVAVPSWVGVLLMVWFIGGFCYLVGSMRRDRDDPDDGAVV